MRCGTNPQASKDVPCIHIHTPTHLPSSQFLGTPSIRPSIQTLSSIFAEACLWIRDSASASRYQFIETETCMRCAVLLPRFVRLGGRLEGEERCWRSYSEYVVHCCAIALRSIHLSYRNAFPTSPSIAVLLMRQQLIHLVKTPINATLIPRPQ